MEFKCSPVAGPQTGHCPSWKDVTCRHVTWCDVTWRVCRLFAGPARHARSFQHRLAYNNNSNTRLQAHPYTTSQSKQFPPMITVIKALFVFKFPRLKIGTFSALNVSPQHDWQINNSTTRETEAVSLFATTDKTVDFDFFFFSCKSIVGSAVKKMAEPQKWVYWKFVSIVATLMFLRFERKPKYFVEEAVVH